MEFCEAIAVCVFIISGFSFLGYLTYVLTKKP